MSLLCFFPSYYAFKQFSRNLLIMVKKVPIMPVYYGIKKFYHWRQWACSFTRFSGLTVFSSVSTVPRLLRLPARRDSRDLALLCEVRKSRQACSIMKRLKRRFLGRTPGSPLAHFWSCRQYYYQNEARYRAIALSLDSLASCCSNLQSTTPFAEHYTCITPVKLPDYSGIMPYAFADWLFW